MKKILGLIVLVSGSCFFAQNTHEVQAKETPYSIAKKYNLSVQDLYKLNPNMEGATLSLGQVVNVKKTTSTPKITPKTSSKFTVITVQPKQTLYGITKQYNITEKELLALNPHIAGGMKIGDNLQIPSSLVSKQEVSKPVNEIKPSATNTVVNGSDAITYTVQPKDTYYGICKKFDITKEKLLELNPGLEEKGLQPNETIYLSVGNQTNLAKKVIKKEPVVQNEENTEIEPTTAKVKVNDNTYTVQDGDTVFSILNKFSLSWDELLELNPRLSAGLQTDMKLKIRKQKESLVSYKKNNSNPLEISLLLPLNLDNDNSQFKKMALDFLSGAKLAASRYVASGKSLKMKVLDIAESSNVEALLRSNNVKNSDVIVGPFFKSNLIAVLDEVKEKQIPVVSPFANSSDLYAYSNLIISETNKNVYAKRIAKEVVLSYSDETVYILADTNNNEIAESIEKELKASKKITKVQRIKSMSEVGLDKNLMTGQVAPTSVVLCSDAADLGLDFTQGLIKLSEQSKGMKSFSVFYHNVFEKEENALSNTRLVYLMDRKINTEGETEKEIISLYKKEYCSPLSKYAIIGYDVVSDILQRENDKAELFQNLTKSQTQLATKFEYEKSDEGAYLNTGYRVIRLNP